ncbi:MAG: hypothetical protein IH588_03595 [Anaerolineales bacterium]|nr:hypothetical protein [Anaerolineales bacterium]
MTSKQPLKETQKKISEIIEVIKTFWVPIVGLIGAVILGVQFLELLRAKPNLILDVIVILLFGTTLFIFYYLTSQRKKMDNKNKAFFIVLILGALVGAFWVKGQAARQTDYFILDASENTGELFQQVRAKLNLTLTVDSIPNNKDVGLAVFGGGTRGNYGCSDIEELVPPSPKEKSAPQIDAVVNSLVNNKPSGPGNIQGAILFVLEKLRSRPGTPRIVLITSGIDESCARLDRTALDKFAQENNSRFELVILTVNVNEADQIKLRAYATNQILINAENSDQISNSIEVILNAPPASSDIYYFGYYGYIPTSDK